jgi:uncharacterized protein
LGICRRSLGGKAMPSELQTATMVELIKKVSQKKKQLGKTQFQKLVYFCQEKGIPLGYKYEIYHYGPYSFQLSDDMSSLDSLGVLDVGTDSSGFGFHIEAGRFASKYELQKKYLPVLTEVVEKLGENSPAQLEVKGTLHFVSKVLKNRGDISDKLVVSKVKELKPQIKDPFIQQCYVELKAAKLI